MMNAYLVNPKYQVVYGKAQGIASIIPPTGLAYIAAVLLAHSFEVRILDANAEELDSEQIEKMIEGEHPTVVGITSTTPTISEALDIARITKRVSREIIVVLGGPHPTALPREVANDENVDVVVRGEGEATMLELIDKIDKGQKFDEILGITYKKGNKIIDNPSRPLIADLDQLPYPARHLLTMGKYFSPQIKRKSFANILTSRGCPSRCNYCNKNIFGYKYRARSPQSIIAEIEFLMNNYGIEEFHILDDMFTLDKARVERFCELIIEKKLDIAWKCGNGIAVNTVNREQLRKMKEAGCYSVSFGIESGSQDILDNIGKKITLEQSRNAVKLSKEAGIFTIGFFMFGNLGENEQTMKQTIKFAKCLNPDVAQFGILVPFPGTDIRRIIEAEGKILTTRWQDYGNLSGQAIFEHGALTKPLMEKMYRKAYREFYIRPGYIFKKLIGIRSLSEIKTYIGTLSSLLKIMR